VHVGTGFGRAFYVYRWIDTRYIRDDLQFDAKNWWSTDKCCWKHYFIEFMGAAFIGLFFGLVAEKYEKKTLLIMTQLLSIFFGTYRIFATSSTILGITSFFHGGFSAATATIMSTILVMKTSSENRARFLGLNLSAGMFTGVIANVVGGLLGDAFGFRIVLLFSSLSRILALYPILKLDATSSSANEESDEAPSIASFSKIFKIRDSKEVKTILYYFLSNVNVGLGAGLLWCLVMLYSMTFFT